MSEYADFKRHLGKGNGLVKQYFKKYGQNKHGLSNTFFTLEYRNCFFKKN